MPLATSSPDKAKTKKVKAKQRSQLKVLVINFQSVKNKSDQLEVCTEMEKPDLIIGTETWLFNSVSSSELLPKGYSAIRKDS